MNEHDSSKNGDGWPEFLGRLMDRHAARLELYARQLCDCPEDAVQEALIELVGQTRLPNDALAWLYRVVRNKAISAARSRQRRRRRETEAAGDRTVWFERSAADLVDAQVAVHLLASLTRTQREIVVARIWGGLSFQQLGRLVGVSDSTAHRHYEAALSALRQKMEASCLKDERTTN